MVRAFVLPFLCLLVSCEARDQAPPSVPPSGADAAAAADGATEPALTYPQAKVVDHVDRYHGVDVRDPYRWLEDLDGPETRTWIEAQNKLTFGYLDGIEVRDALRKRLTALWNYERWGAPKKHGGRYFVTKNDGLQNQPVLYVLEDLAKPPRVLLDPNTLSADGTVALSKWVVSKDGKKLAYGVSESGSDWEVWRVRNVDTGKDTADVVRHVKFAVASWTPDGKGFFYSRYAAPKKGADFEALNYNQKLYYHRLGDKQSADRLVYERPDHKKWGFDGEVTEDGRYLVITVRVGTERKKAVFFQDLKARKAKRKTTELLGGFTASWEFIANDGPVMWFLTDEGAPRGRVVAVDTRKPQKSNWRELIGQSTETLTDVRHVGGRLVASYLADAYSKIRVFGADGKHQRDIALPGIGTARGFTGHGNDDETFYTFTGFTAPTTVYRYDVKKGSGKPLWAPKLGFDPAKYETKQVFYESRDGTKVPMFISHKKGIELDGARPTYLYGYGGFNISITPRFSVPDLVWMEMGGVYAVPNLRGGGEYGEAWHKAGTKLQKQNVFDDFIFAAQWLVEHEYTRPDKLAIGGRSNGGLLVGAAITQRPDLFAAAIPGVGVMDMLRFDQFTIGWAWTSDYGSTKNADEFQALLAYSPYHNVKPGTAYPATLIYTADHDDRVVPAHSYKFAAALQAAQSGRAPTLIRIDTKAGHGAGKPTTKLIEEWTDLWGFLMDRLQMDARGLGA